MKMMLNTEVNAPNFCFEVIPLRSDGKPYQKKYKPIFVQSDQDYVPFADAFGWSIRQVQRCRDCGKVVENKPLDDHNPGILPTGFVCEGCDMVEQDYAQPCCDHDSTDGSIPCRECGTKPGDFSAGAYNYIFDNDGAIANDPGYFSDN